MLGQVHQMTKEMQAVVVLALDKIKLLKEKSAEDEIKFRTLEKEVSLE